MYNLKSAGYVALVCAGLAFNIASASAAEAAGLSGCVQQAKQVKSALEANQQSANYSDAIRQQHFGRDFCSNGLYQTGINHYAEALKLLDPAKS